MKFRQKIFPNKMTQPTISIVFRGMETIGEKRCDHLFLRWEDLLVPSIRKEPYRADVSLEDLQLLKSCIHS